MNLTDKVEINWLGIVIIQGEKWCAWAVWALLTLNFVAGALLIMLRLFT